MVTLSPRWQAFTVHQSAWVGEFGLENFRLLLSEVQIIAWLLFLLHSCQPGFRSFVLYPDIADMTCSK